MTKKKAAAAEAATDTPAAPKKAAPAPKFNLAAMRNDRFAGYPRSLLDKAGELILGYIPSEVIPDGEVVELLCKQLNLPAPRASGPQRAPGEREATDGRVVALPQPKVGKLGAIPNLSSIGRWEGRMRRVSLGATGTAAETITLGWDGAQRWTIEVPDVVDMPWPYWCRIRDSVHVDNLSNKARKFKFNEETEQLEIVVRKDAKTGLPGIRRPVYNYQDMGDVPGTEHLPTSYFEYFQEQAKATECFRGFNRQALQLIYSKIRDVGNSDVFEKKDATDIRMMIAKVLGPEAVLQMNTEIYGAE